jgi:hypothetical protein
LIQNEALASKHMKVAHLGWSTETQLIRSFLHEGSKKDAIRNMTRGVDHFGPIPPRSPMLIEHRPGHLNQGMILALNNTILLRATKQGKLVLKT